MYWLNLLWAKHLKIIWNLILSLFQLSAFKDVIKQLELIISCLFCYFEWTLNVVRALFQISKSLIANQILNWSVKWHHRGKNRDVHNVLLLWYDFWLLRLYLNLLFWLFLFPDPFGNLLLWFIIILSLQLG